jgi:hypothetical protein
MAMIEIKDLNLVSDVQDSQYEVLDLSITPEICGGFNYDLAFLMAQAKTPNQPSQKPTSYALFGLNRP